MNTTVVKEVNKPMPKYSHAYTLAFEVESSDEEAGDVTPAMFKSALLRRIAEMDEENSWHAACGAPFDTIEIEEEVKR